MGNLRVRLVAGRPLVKRHTENLEAYNLFLRARQCIFRETPESFAKAKEYLEQAIALDPNYALPYTAMAEYYSANALWGVMVGSEAISQAKSAALPALKLDDTSAEARRVVELDPLSPSHNTYLGYLYNIAGQHDLAMVQQRRAMDLDPSLYLPHFLIAVTYWRVGRLEEATAAAPKACELSGRNGRTLGVLACVYGLTGRQNEARALLEALTTQCRTTYVPPFAMLWAHVGLGVG